MRIIDADDAIKKYAHYGIDHMWDATDLEEILNEMPSIKTKEIKYFDEDDCVWKIGRVIVSSSEKPNNSKVSEIPTGSEKPNNCEDEPMKTTDYCDICKRDMCEDCIADATNPYCVPSHYEINYEPKTEPQTDLVNDSQVLAKDLVDDEFNPYDEECMRCKHLKLKCEFIPTYCKFESRDEPQTSGLVWTEDAIKNEPKSYTTWASTDETQTERNDR